MRISSVPGGRCVSLHVCSNTGLRICVSPSMGVQGVSGCWVVVCWCAGGGDKVCEWSPVVQMHETPLD